MIFKIQNIVKAVPLAILCLLLPVKVSAQSDTLEIAQPGEQRVVSPFKATMLAAAFPGMGQVYNRKYWKIPLVYAGFGAVGYSIVFNTSNFNSYLKGYQVLTDDIPETNSYIKMLGNST